MTFSDRGILSEVTLLCLNFVIFTSLLFLFETRTIFKVWTFVRRLVIKTLPITTAAQVRVDHDEDDNVRRERNRIGDLVLRNAFEEEALVVHELRKEYAHKNTNVDNIPAVDSLSLSVHHGECFGLLGVNGAGKTTTFKMLTGDLRPSSGEAFIRSFGLKSDLRSYQENIGYCPQYDAHLDKLTGLETLSLFGRLRGIKEKNLMSEVNLIVKLVDLSKHAKKLTETYSGGNRRKLSLGVALMGTPPLLMLDEPTAGKFWVKLIVVIMFNVYFLSARR